MEPRSMNLASAMGGPSAGVGGGEAPGVHSTNLKPKRDDSPSHSPTSARQRECGDVSPAMTQIEDMTLCHDCGAYLLSP